VEYTPHPALKGLKGNYKNLIITKEI